jgi:hypothetical protein
MLDSRDRSVISDEAVAICQFHSVFRIFRALLPVAGQAPVSVGQCAKCRFDAPAERERLEALRLGIAVTCGDLKIDAMPLGGGVDRWADINAIDIDPLKAPSIFGRPLKKSIDHFRVVNVGGRNDNGEDEAERTGQDVPFHALDLLFPSNPRSPFCGADTTLCESMIPVDGSLAWP